jgi:hypothetical protein
MKNLGVHVPDLELLAIFKGVIECLVELRRRHAVVRPEEGLGVFGSTTDVDFRAP